MGMKTYEQFNKAFATDEACKEYIVAKRWPDGVRCPRCNRKEKVYALKSSVPLDLLQYGLWRARRIPIQRHYAHNLSGYESLAARFGFRLAT